MKNERITEQLVRDELSKLGYKSDPDSSVEEQKSVIASVKRALATASKSGKGGLGAPEFIITNIRDTDFVVVVECKASVKDHQSGYLDEVLAGSEIAESDVERIKRLQRFAVDGGLHYGEALSRTFNVIVIAVSGATRSELLVSTFLRAKGSPVASRLTTKDGQVIDRILSWDDFVDHATFDHAVQKLRYDELMAFSRDLHDFMRSHAKLTEGEKPLVVSGTLIALRNNAFAISYDAYEPDDLQKEWLRIIEVEIEKAAIPKAKKRNMTQPYSGIAVHPELGKSTKDYPKGVLNELGSGLVDHSQKMTVAARATAEKKTVGHRS